jgi:hypothetical protein
VITWGYPLYTHIHSFIHYRWYKTLFILEKNKIVHTLQVRKTVKIRMLNYKNNPIKGSIYEYLLKKFELI